MYKMIKIVCDRCKNIIEGSTYYTINIYGHDIEPKNDGTVSAKTACQNAYTNSLEIFRSQRHYCEDCKNIIERIMLQEKSGI